MDFTGHLNFANPTAMANAIDSKAFNKARLGLPTTIHDARPLYGVQAQPADSTELLTDGAGFLLVRSPSVVRHWDQEKEVASHYYEESRAMLQQLFPSAVVPPIKSHTFRNEQIKEHYWVDGIQYGPCATGVHNDYADFVSSNGTTVTRKFTEVIGLPTDRRVIGINIWRSVTAAPLERMPLAVCDRTTVDPDDLEYDLNPNAKPAPFNAHYCKPNPEQKWYYYSHMTSEEALVFTTYDSHPNGGEVFRPTLHTAVAIPDTDGLQPRVSVEIRFFVNLPLPG
ncbi:MAG: CmcJ/NvfI family oxidoreductase [Proteobacteria bacterium]|jgi:hypothetical protein|nr:CmcJ/NvfI family oxidoreductase [Pseudomonadota bacterium]MDA1301316.1 CmcJ/NvfI family oxidoreductase [Pseudomonadota bacterium]